MSAFGAFNKSICLWRSDTDCLPHLLAAAAENVVDCDHNVHLKRQYDQCVDIRAVIVFVLEMLRVKKKVRKFDQIEKSPPVEGRAFAISDRKT